MMNKIFLFLSISICVLDPSQGAQKRSYSVDSATAQKYSRQEQSAEILPQGEAPVHRSPEIKSQGSSELDSSISSEEPTIATGNESSSSKDEENTSSPLQNPNKAKEETASGTERTPIPEKSWDKWETPYDVQQMVNYIRHNLEYNKKQRFNYDSIVKNTCKTLQKDYLQLFSVLYCAQTLFLEIQDSSPQEVVPHEITREFEVEKKKLKSEVIWLSQETPLLLEAFNKLKSDNEKENACIAKALFDSQFGETGIAREQGWDLNVLNGAFFYAEAAGKHFFKVFKKYTATILEPEGLYPTDFITPGDDE